MILEWMAYAALCTALIALAAWSVDEAFSAVRRARRMVWMIAIAASTIAPFALPFRPHPRPVSIQSTSAKAAAPTAGAVASSPASTRLDAFVLSAWGFASAVFALVLIIAHRRTSSALKRCRPAMVAGCPAFVSNDFGPAIVGILRHRVVVPAWTLELPEEEQRLVVAHELEHAHSGDPLLAVAGVCAVALMPWNPALWWQLSRLRLAIELDCDARVVARKAGDAIAYSRLLVSVGERALATRQPVLAMSRSRSALAKRFDALLTRTALEPRRALALSMLAIGTVASVAFVPSPNIPVVVDALRVRPPMVSSPASLIARPETARAIFTPGNVQPTVGVVERRPSRGATARPRSRLNPVGDVMSLPPVSVVPSTVRGPLDSVVVTSAMLPPTSIRRGGVLMASPTGTAGRGGFSASAGLVSPSGPDSNRVTLGGRGGGRAVIRARPDTTKSNR